MTGIILVKDIMTKDVKTVTPQSSVMVAIQKMNKFDIGSVVVVQGKKPVGIITERDLLKKIVEPWLDPGEIKAREIMVTPPITIREDVSLEEAAEIMVNKRIKKLLVEKDEKLLGIITATDLVRSAPKLISLLEGLIWRAPREHSSKKKKI